MDRQGLSPGRFGLMVPLALNWLQKLNVLLSDGLTFSPAVQRSHWRRPPTRQHCSPLCCCDCASARGRARHRMWADRTGVIHLIEDYPANRQRTFRVVSKVGRPRARLLCIDLDVDALVVEQDGTGIGRIVSVGDIFRTRRQPSLIQNVGAKVQKNGRGFSPAVTSLSQMALVGIAARSRTLGVAVVARLPTKDRRRTGPAGRRLCLATSKSRRWR
jgi:hypothetical protein